MKSADLVVTDGRITTGSPGPREATALAVNGGRISFVGTDTGAERRVGPRTRVLRVRGRRVLPGFIDAHCHLIWGYELGRFVDLTGQPSLTEIFRRVRRYARRHPEEEVIVGHGFDYAAVSETQLPGREELDQILSDRPVLLTAWDGHTGWGNTAFFERARRWIRLPGPDLGEVERDPRTGRPTGILHRTFDLTPHLPEFRARRSLSGLRAMVRRALSFGITTAFDVQVNVGDLVGYQTLWRRGELPIRISAAIYHPKQTPRRQYAHFLRAAHRLAGPHLTVGAIKLYIDGVQETGTAALLEPYADRPASRGQTVYGATEFGHIVTELDRLGFQLLTHACGDRGVRIALNAYALAAGRNQTRGRRHRIEHCEGISPDDLSRFAELDVVPCMMPRHSAPELTRKWRLALGPRRTREGFPWREVLWTGAHLAFSSDWPVSELNPWIGVHEAVNRMSPDGGLSPHRLTVEEAIQAYTQGAAYASHCETERGALRVGCLADMVVVDPDPFSVRLEQLRSTRVQTTIVGGQIAHRARPGHN